MEKSKVCNRKLGFCSQKHFDWTAHAWKHLQRQLMVAIWIRGTSVDKKKWLFVLIIYVMINQSSTFCTWTCLLKS